METALFLSALQGEGLLLGSFIGLIIAAGISALLYKTTIKLDLRKFFIITGSLLILVAAGLMAHTIHALGELGIVPAIIEHLWNLEWLISDESLLRRILHAFVGYESMPSLMQVIVYIGYVVVVGRMFLKDSTRGKISKNL